MQVILLSRIKNLGETGEVVKVKNGYARNWLIPNGYVKQATPKNLAWLQTVKDKLEKLGNEKLLHAEELASQIAEASISLVREADEEGNLYGAVRVSEILKEIETAKLPVLKNQISFAKPIRKIGLHEIVISFHPSVVTRLKCQVTRK